MVADYRLFIFMFFPLLLHDADRDFPATYETILRKIQRLLFHVVAHLYHRHFRELLLLGLHGHLHGLFAHLILFNSRFRLIDEKETEILHDLVIALRLQTTGNQDGRIRFPQTLKFKLIIQFEQWTWNFEHNRPTIVWPETERKLCRFIYPLALVTLY